MDGAAGHYVTLRDITTTRLNTSHLTPARGENMQASNLSTPMSLVAVPVYFEVAHLNRSGVVGGAGVLVCNAWGDTPISVVWRRGGQQIYSSTDRSDTRHITLAT